MFNFASELGLYQDAYTAAISNPVPEKSADAVTRLVQALVERQELAQLLLLPWSGVVLLERKGIREPVPIVQVGHSTCLVISEHSLELSKSRYRCSLQSGVPVSAFKQLLQPQRQSSCQAVEYTDPVELSCQDEQEPCLWFVFSMSCSW